MDPFLLNPPIVERIEIGIQRKEGDFYDNLVLHLSVADLVRNYPTMICETKEETVKMVSEYLRSQGDDGLCVLRREDGFNIITTLPYVGDAEATAPTGIIVIPMNV